MAFVPTKQKPFKKGDKGFLKEDIRLSIGTFEKGTEMTITRVSPMRGYDLVDSEGNRVLECGFDIFE